MSSDAGSEVQRQPQSMGEPFRARSGGAQQWLKPGLIGLSVVAIVASAAAFMPDSSSSHPSGPLPTHTVRRGTLDVTVTEQGTLESSNNTEIKCRVRGDNTITRVVKSGTMVKPGDELLRLDTLLIEEEISERTKYAHLARSGAERARADMVRAEIAISEYLEGRFVSDLATLKKDLAIAEAKLVSARNILRYKKKMAERGYASKLEVEEKDFAVKQAELDVKLKKTKIDVLKNFTKAEELATLKGNYKAAKAKYEAEKERAYADEKRLKRAQIELEHCVIEAKRSGIVIYPTGKQWEEAPDIEEGATVHKDQVLLLMPDLSKMQVKVGIHESVIDRIKPGLTARVALPGKTLESTVSSVASVAVPAGWWTGNVVKYDTIIKLPAVKGLKPGMSVAVEVRMARHENVLLIPTAAVIEAKKGHACWVKTADGIQRRALKLGDGSKMFIVVKAGLKEGDEVVLNPLANIEEAQDEAATTLKSTKKAGSGSTN